MSAAFTLERRSYYRFWHAFCEYPIFFRVMQVELQVQKALDDTGRKLASISVRKDYVPGLAAAGRYFTEMSGRRGGSYLYQWW